MFGFTLFALLGLLFVKKPIYASPWDDIWAAVTALQTQMNALSLTPGATGSTGPVGPTGASGTPGTPGIAGSTISFYQAFSAVRTIPPGTSGYAQAFCNTGDTVTGGGYDASIPSLGDKLMEIYSNIPFGTASWAVTAINPGTNINSQDLAAFAVCAHYN